jgi:N-acetyl-S-(2-succino)cysteine monooxygenase
MKDQSERKLRLASFMFTPSGHLGAWRMPDAIPNIDMGFEHYVHLAQLSERGKMDALFFQDIAAVPRSNDLLKGDTYGGISIRATCLEPMTLLPALAVVTSHIGLVATATATYNEPYNLARKFATLDHISGGRAGWNLVTSQNENEAQNFNLDQHVDHAQRYERASEFYDVVAGLWDSWDENAITRDKTTGVYFDIDKLHILNHKGKHFKVRGPLNVARSPQGHPVVAQAGSSEPGRELAAKTADIVFTAQQSIAQGQAFYADVKGRCDRYGRTPDEIKIMPSATPIIGHSESEAQELREQMRALIPEDLAITQLMQLSGGLDLRPFPPDGPQPALPPSNSAKARQQLTIERARRENLSLVEVARYHAEAAGHLTIVGTPAQIADEMEERLRKDAADGFTIIHAYYPRPVEEFVQFVIPRTAAPRHLPHRIRRQNAARESRPAAAQERVRGELQNMSARGMVSRAGHPVRRTTKACKWKGEPTR